MSETEVQPSAVLGWGGFLLGAVAFLMAVTLFWAGPFAPQQTAGVTLGELAADVAQSAVRKVAGREQPAPEPVARNIDDYLEIAVSVIAALAVILGAAALVRHEKKRPAIAAASLGAAAIVFQFFVWYAFALLGVLLIFAVMQSLGGFFERLFGG